MLMIGGKQMSKLYGKWSVEDIRDVIRGLDARTGMKGASIPIFLCKTLGDGSTLGSYSHGERSGWRFFSFSLKYFDDSNFNDLGAIDVIRHEYCHHLVDVLELNVLFNDEDDHGIAWKTICGLLNTDQHETYSAGYFPRVTDESFMEAYMSEDIQPVDILEQVNRWGLTLPSLKRRKYLEKTLIKKYSKLRVFSAGDYVFHEKFGYGEVLDTFPSINKQLLYVKFEQGENRIVQNRKVCRKRRR